MGPIHPVWGHVLVSLVSGVLSMHGVRNSSGAEVDGCRHNYLARGAEGHSAHTAHIFLEGTPEALISIPQHSTAWQRAGLLVLTIVVLHIDQL